MGCVLVFCVFRHRDKQDGTGLERVSVPLSVASFSESQQFSEKNVEKVYERDQNFYRQHGPYIKSKMKIDTYLRICYLALLVAVEALR